MGHIYEPMSGADKAAGEAEIKGIELAYSLYPEIDGATVELLYADNKSDINAAETAMADLMKKQPKAVLGSYGNIYSLIAGPHLQAAEVPGIAITNTNPLVTKNNPYAFRVSTVETYQASAMARYVYEELGQEKAGVLIPENNEQALAMASTFENKLDELTGSNAVRLYQYYVAGSADYTAQLQMIKSSGLKSVYLCGDYEDIACVLKNAGDLDLEVLFLGDSSWGTEEFINMAGDYAYKNVAFSTLYTEEEIITETSEEFLRAYAEEYGDETPDPATALGFDAYLILKDAIERAGVDCTGAELQQALLETSTFQGASGVISFNNYGDPKKSVIINPIDNGQISSLCTMTPHATVKKTEEEEN
ncbi:MAG: ABC transporter substrate-binding protein [Anaerotignum sp.]|nr:ABC transporter substrate-binding protein [Anaerotignum sp.]